MVTAFQLLGLAGVRSAPYGRPPVPGVVVTAANQLMGTYRDVTRFQSRNRHYAQWHAHHIVEFQDFARLGISQPLTPYEEHLCVLLPERAHVGRVNSALRTANPGGVTVTARDLRNAYRDAYMMIGDYCGGGEIPIRRELVALVDATFKAVGAV